MKIYTTLRMGSYHLNHCEDYLISTEIGNDKLLLAVMDGCTMGKESYFASTLTGKLLQKIAKKKSYEQLYAPNPTTDSLETTLKNILKDLFSELLQLKSQLLLEQNDLLTTLLIALYHSDRHEAYILIIGDGLICINGNTTEFDQDNKPDYIGFHLNKDFETWYASHTQKISADKISDLSLSTDGITLFDRISRPTEETAIDPIEFLLNDTSQADKEDMLHLKLKRLEHIHGLQPGDDIAIIRLLHPLTP